MSPSNTSSSRQRTPLYHEHVQLGAKIIDFGGWDMPVWYRAGITDEHKTVRSAVGLFDVSHMGEAWVRGARATEAIQRVTTNDLSKMGDGTALYTVMCYEDGGIIDDCIVYRRRADEYMVVLNAANTAKDLAWLRENLVSAYSVDVVDESEATGLIAVQGPKAVALVDRMSQSDLATIAPFRFVETEVGGVSCLVARTGYTGEDGFELACPAEKAAALWTALLETGAGDGVLPIGLGARDTLRLEARLCLYGNDIDENTNPYEAGLGWVVKPDGGDFIGRESLLAYKAGGIQRKLVGFCITDQRAVARSGYPIVDRSQKGAPEIGRVTSGMKGISVPGSIGMGYVAAEHAGLGSEITIDCRGKDVPATIVKGKFYKRSTV